MRFRLLYLTVATLAAPACRAATDSAPVTWSVEPIRQPRTGDSLTTIEISATIADGWHIYSVDQAPGGPTPTRFAIDSATAFARAGAVVSDPRPIVRFDSSFHMSVAMHEHAVRFSIPVNTARNTRDSAGVQVHYQTCNQTLCYPPQTAHLFASLRSRD